MEKFKPIIDKHFQLLKEKRGDKSVTPLAFLSYLVDSTLTSVIQIAGVGVGLDERGKIEAIEQMWVLLEALRRTLDGWAGEIREHE